MRLSALLPAFSNLLAAPFRRDKQLLDLPFPVLERILLFLSEDLPPWDGRFSPASGGFSALCVTCSRLYTLSRPFLWRRLLFVPENMGRRGAKRLFRMLEADESLGEALVELQIRSLAPDTCIQRGRTPSYQSLVEDEGVEHTQDLVQLLTRLHGIRVVVLHCDTLSSGVLLHILQAIVDTPSRLTTLSIRIWRMINAPDATRDLHYAIDAAAQRHAQTLEKLHLDHHAGLLHRVGFVESEGLVSLPTCRDLRLGGHPVLRATPAPADFHSLRSLSLWNVELPWVYADLIPNLPSCLEAIALSYDDDGYNFRQRPPVPTPPRLSQCTALRTVRIRIDCIDELNLVLDLLMLFSLAPHTSLEWHANVSLANQPGGAAITLEDNVEDWLYFEISPFFDDPGFMPRLRRMAIYLTEVSREARRRDGDEAARRPGVNALLDNESRFAAFQKRVDARGLELSLIEYARPHAPEDVHGW